MKIKSSIMSLLLRIVSKFLFITNRSDLARIGFFDYLLLSAPPSIIFRISSVLFVAYPTKFIRYLSDSFSFPTEKANAIITIEIR